MVTSVWILDQSVQLSIRKSSCSALAELHIRIRVENTVFPEMIYRFFSFGRHFSPFETSGQYPALARYHAQKSPAGPLPTMTGDESAPYFQVSGNDIFSFLLT